MAERTPLAIDEDDDLDISSLVRNKKATLNRGNEAQAVKESAESSGFTSRPISKKRRKGRKSPYTEQKGIKVRPEMKELFEDVADNLDFRDHTLFEMALLALLEKRKMREEVKRYKAILSDKP